MVLQLENRLRESLERLRLKEQNSAAARNSVGTSNHLEAALQQLVSTVQTQANRLAKLETSCFSGSSGAGTGTNSKRSLLPEQEVTSRQDTLGGLQAALLQVRVGLAEVLSSWQQRFLPAGETSISSSRPSSPAVSAFTFLHTTTHITSHLHIFFSADTFRSGFSSRHDLPPDPNKFPVLVVHLRVCP